MSKINDLIKEMCPKGVEKIPLGSLMNRIKEKNYDNSGIDTVYSVTKENGIVKSDDLHDFNVYSDDLSNYSILRKNQYAYNPARLNIGSIARLKNDEVGLVSPMYVIFELDQEKIDFEYFEHLLFSQKVFNDMCSFVEQGARFRFDYKNWNKIIIDLPPLKIQKEIVRILNKFLDMQNILEVELEARKSQYEFWRGKIINMYENKNIKLSDMAKVYDGTHSTPNYQENGIPFISVENISDIYGSNKFISKEDYMKYKIKPEINDVFMTRIGTIGKCSVFEKQIDLAYYVSLALIRPNTEIILPKYLKYVIESNVGKNELYKRTLVHAVPIKVNKDEIGKIVLPVPSIEDQKKIISKLDRFESLTESISVGLPAEIELRRKQYEYYRNKLLSFEELSVSE